MSAARKIVVTIAALVACVLLVGCGVEASEVNHASNASVARTRVLPDVEQDEALRYNLSADLMTLQTFMSASASCPPVIVRANLDEETSIVKVHVTTYDASVCLEDARVLQQDIILDAGNPFSEDVRIVVDSSMPIMYRVVNNEDDLEGGEN